MKTRLIGVVLLLLAAFAAYISVYAPIHDAQTHVAQVRTSLKGAFVAPLSLLIGLGMLVGGPRFQAALENSPEKAQRWGKASVLGWVLFVIGGGIGVALYFWVMSQLHALGYG